MGHELDTTGFVSHGAAPLADSALGSFDRTAFDAASLGVATFKGWSRTREDRAARPLSPRERQIVALLVEGKSQKEVAFDLAIAHSTVRVLYARAMKKLGGHWQPAGGRR